MTRILIVDDEPQICRLYSASLEAEDIETEVATSFEDAERLIGEHRFDGALIDLCLPGASGHRLVPILLSASPRARPIVMSAMAGPDAEAILASMGVPVMDKYLEPPALIPYWTRQTDTPQAFVDPRRDRVNASIARTALAFVDGNVTRAARRLGIPRKRVRQYRDLGDEDE